MPIIVKADSGLDSNYKESDSAIAELITGKEFNIRVQNLVLGDVMSNLEWKYDESYEDDHLYSPGGWYLDFDYDDTIENDNYISKIKKASYEEFEIVKNSLTEDNIILTDSSTVPVYIWYSNNIIYYYSNASK